MDQSGAFTGDHVAFLYQVASRSCLGSESQIAGGEGVKFSWDIGQGTYPWILSMGVLISPQMGSGWGSHNMCASVVTNVDLNYEI